MNYVVERFGEKLTIPLTQLVGAAVWVASEAVEREAGRGYEESEDWTDLEKFVYNAQRTGMSEEEIANEIINALNRVSLKAFKNIFLTAGSYWLTLLIAFVAGVLINRFLF